MSEVASTSHRTTIAEAIGKLWWLVLLRGILLLLLGIYALTQPGMSLVAFTTVLAAFVLVDGMFAVAAGILGETDSRGWTIARGVLGILVGLFVFAHPVVVGAIAATILVLVIALQSIFTGVMEIIVAIRERKQIEGEGWLILSGVLSVIFGGLLLTAPFAFGLVLIQVFGVFAIICGIALIVYSFRIRSLPGRLSGE